MAKPKPDSPAAQAEALSIPARLLLFCVAARTDWERAGIPRATVTTMVVRGLIERDVAGRLTKSPSGDFIKDCIAFVTSGGWKRV